MNTEAEKNETLMGGKELTITKLDKTTERVLVRQLPVSAMSRYASCVTDETAMVELFCDKPDGWADTLTNESFEEIIDEGERINEFFFARWRDRQRRRAERISPGIQEKIASQITSQSLQSAAALPSKKQ